MIRRIRLSQWRAYETLNLELSRPVTFFVAPNGVGKTSLVEAVRWGLLGAPPARRLGQAVRVGHESATVCLDLVLADTEVQLTRSIKRSGTARFDAKANGMVIDEAAYTQLLRRAWAADPGLLDTLIFGVGAKGEVTGFPIKDHLADIFGITPMLQAAKAINTRRSELAAKIKTLRDDLSGTDEAIASVTETVSRLEAELSGIADQREAAHALARRLEPAATLAQAWSDYRENAHAFDEQVRRLVAGMAGSIDLGDQDPRAAIARNERAASSELESSLAAASAAEVRAARAASAAEVLASATDQCPTCLRPLTPAEREAAASAHGGVDDAAHAEIEQRSRDTARARERLIAITGFRDSLNALHPPTEPGGDDPGAEAVTELAEARQRLSDLAERHGDAAARLGAARSELARLRQAAHDQSTLVAAAREDTVMEVTEKTIHELADRYLTDYIEPIAHEVGRRWKLVFGTDGLHFDADGHLTIPHGDATLMVGDLSGGERSTALLVTRLLLASSVARASTVCFDEPLEHLDPRRRAAVAQTLVSAVQAGTVGQILITTYEERLARRLASAAPDVVELTYATTDSA
ncbi:AAA family ATPase [Streptomyces sp. TG1A-60]|uniref:AAA family ATPase n=1 Tax=Streptomyces sp. TG1A-60 TaxID=3129111 RepID=UPI0030D4E464